MRIPGFTSTGSKRPDALFGPAAPRGLPVRFSRAAGCEVWDAEGRRYLDFVSALGAVALGYGHPAVNAAAHAAIDAGVVGPLPPEQEERLAERLAALIPWMERTRFLKSGAEAVAAAVRLARVHTGRDLLLRAGYHGWLDWCQPAGTPGVPASVFAMSDTLTFNDAEAARVLIRRLGDRLAAIVIEPVIEGPPTPEWLGVLREESRRVGALLVVDEIKTGFRLALGGACERFGLTPDLIVLGKALGNGFPIAAVGGRRDVMERARETWISSTLATEIVALAAAESTVAVMAERCVPEYLGRMGQRLRAGLEVLAGQHPDLIAGVAGMPEMAYLRFTGEERGWRMARAAAGRGLLFKRTPYNFVSLAHGEAEIDRALAILAESLEEVLQGPRP
jgi:glutamate-1-semialdehyde 2,1-aminomutase